MMSRFRFCAVVLFSLLALPLAADTPMTRLRVEVLTLSGRPVDRASVVLDFVEGRNYMKLGRKVLKHWEARTSQDGIAKFPTIPQGKIRVQVIAKGYQTYGQIFDVEKEEQQVTVKLNPPQAQHSEHQ
jgi:hypothetical protein